MIHSKGKFYWSDALYLARTKSLLILMEETDGVQIFQCTVCSTFVKFDSNQSASGQWQRIKPYEQFKLRKKLGPHVAEPRSLKEIENQSKTRKLFQCPNCASHWWHEENGWTNADDAVVEK